MVAGIDLRLDGSVRLAFVDHEAVDYPTAADLHRNLRAFERYWNRRFKTDRPIDLSVGLASPGALRPWFEERHVRVVDLEGHDLKPFLRESVNYETPPRYRRAHALAQCAALRLAAPHVLHQLHSRLCELNFHLREVEKTLHRVAAASTPI